MNNGYIHNGHIHPSVDNGTDREPNPHVSLGMEETQENQSAAERVFQKIEGGYWIPFVGLIITMVGQFYYHKRHRLVVERYLNGQGRYIDTLIAYSESLQWSGRFYVAMASMWLTFIAIVVISRWW
jgi:hypothetical protein